MPRTINEIVDFCISSLKPEVALLNWERDWRPHCVSPTVTEVRDESGAIIPLNHSNGRIAAAYVRVSTIEQRGDALDDGYSVRQQLEYNIHAAVRDRLAFRVYSDAGMSGFLMTADPTLIQEVRQAQAELYAEIYEEVLLRGAESWNTPQQIADMRIFLESRKKAILSGEKESFAYETANDRNYSRIEEVLVRRYQNHRNKSAWRPALHALTEDLVEIHRIYMTDPDRLSRNHLLWVTLGKVLRSQDVQIETSAGDAKWITGTDLGSQLLAVVLPHEAERRLREIKRGAMRGLVTMLKQGKPHSKLPFWLERDKKGFATFVTDRLPAVEKLLQAALHDEEHIGISRLSQIMDGSGLPPPAGKFWHPDTCNYTLRNPLIYGCQVMLGREWPLKTSGEGDQGYKSPFIPQEERAAIHPLALVTKKQYVQMHDRRQARYQNARGRPTPEKRLMTGLLKCRCGEMMIYKPGTPTSYTPDSYRCNAPTNKRRRARAQGIVHTVLRPNEVNNFFIEMVADYADLLLRQPQSASSVDLDAQEQSVRQEFGQIQTDKENQAKAMLSSVALDTPEGQAAVVATTRALMGEKYEQFQQTLARIERAREINAITYKRSQVANEIHDFRALSSGQQNRILRNILERVEVKGDPGHEYLQVYLHSEDDPLPPIGLRTNVHKDGSLHRHMPTVEEWIASWKAVPIS